MKVKTSQEQEEYIRQAILYLKHFVENDQEVFSENMKGWLQYLASNIQNSHIPQLIAIGSEYDGEKQLKYYRLLSSNSELEIKLDTYIAGLSSESE